MFFRVGKNDLKVIFNYIGLLLMWSSLAFILPLIIVLIYNEPKQNFLAYLFCFIITIIVGYLIKTQINPENKQISFSVIHATLVAVIFWILFNILTSLPFMLIENMSFINSFFESISATTTTGLSVIHNFAPISHSILMWRSLLSWFGGLGVVLLALLGVLTTAKNFGLLAKAEGHDSLATPNLKKTVFLFWYIYISITALGALALTFFGMKLFYAINYAMSAISTTGMESSNIGLMSNGLGVQIIIAFLMVFGATSFITHYLAMKKKSIKEYFRDYEFIFLISLTFFGSVLLAIKLNLFDILGIISSIITAASAATGGGFPSVPQATIALWGEFLLIITIFLMFIGGSTASTAGGIKIHRFVLFLKTISWKTKELFLPKKAYFSKKFHTRLVNDEEIKNNLFFIGIYLLFVIITATILTLYGFSFIKSLFETMSAQSNVGLSVGITTATLPLFPKILLIFNMIIGRLEIIPIFALFGLFLKLR